MEPWANGDYEDSIDDLRELEELDDAIEELTRRCYGGGKKKGKGKKG